MSEHPAFDADGYPAEKTLELIESWPCHERESLMKFCAEAWQKDYGWFELTESQIDGEKRWCCATGGWSGNEDIIAALERNGMAWMVSWHASIRGGYFAFDRIDEEAEAPFFCTSCPAARRK